MYLPVASRPKRDTHLLPKQETAEELLQEGLCCNIANNLPLFQEQS